MEPSEEIKKRIEENRLKALQKRQALERERSDQSKPQPPNHGTTFNVTKIKTLPPHNPSIQSKPYSKPATLSCPINVEISLNLVSKDQFEVICSYNKEIIHLFKSLKSNCYDPDRKRWLFNIKDYRALLEKMRPSQYKLNLKELIPPNVIQILIENSSFKPAVNLADKLDQEMLDKMFPFQKEGVQFGILKNGRCLIADDMGLGKTVQSIALALWYRNDWPVVVICPSCVRFQWKDSFLEWIPFLKENDINVIATGKQEITTNQVIVISYDLVIKCKDALRLRKPNFFILDESHYIKTSSAQRTKATLSLIKGAKRIVLLSGTPALSRPHELYPQISAINPKFFKTKHEFGVRYCNAQKNHFGWDYKGATHTEELKIILERTLMIRRMKNEVLTQLPPKRRTTCILPLLLDGDTRRLMSEYLSKIKSAGAAHEYKSLLFEWFGVTAQLKTPGIIQHIKNLIEQDKKFLFFAHHRTIFEAICIYLDNSNCCYIRIDGSTPSHTRQECCDYFQTHSECKIALLSLTAAGIGINLTAAQLVVFGELYWNPGILLQAEDRAHRIGQTDSVLIQYLVSKNTVDDFVWPMITKKIKVLNEVGLNKGGFNTEDPTQSKMEDFFTQCIERECSKI